MPDETTIENVDTLLSNAMEPQKPLAAPGEGELNSVEKSQEVSPASSNQWVITHLGKDIPLDENKYKMYAQKGYDYETKMHQHRVDRNLFSKEKDEWLSQKQATESELAELKQINEYAKANPQWLETVRNSFLQTQQGNGQIGATETLSNPYATQINRLEQVVNQLLSDRQSSLKQKELLEIAEKDARIESDLASYKETYPNFDWEKPDETGLKLEEKILQHAIDNGIKSVKAAARDYLWDEHVKQMQMSTKEKVGKEIQQQNKLGLTSPTSKSQMQVKRAESVRGKSYDDIAAEALKELGL